MANIHSGCYECSKECINDQFCDGSNIALPHALKIKIVANPTYWGFNNGAGNVLISGLAVFSKGHYDFFDGFDETHQALKTCGTTTTGPYENEQRPDVMYRSVYDPEDLTLSQYGGKRHYGGGGTVDNIERGGAEVYLVDRPKGELGAVTGDSPSCDETDPRTVFKKMPENFGFGNKISSTDAVFKNQTGAWRFATYSGCYSGYSTREDCPQCTGVKQQISEMNPLDQILPTGYKKDCLPDGVVPRQYGGLINKVFRGSGLDFSKVQISYFDGASYANGITPTNSGAASGVFSGSMLSISNTGIAGLYPVISISHSAFYSECTLGGSYGSGIFDYPSGIWTLNNSSDPQSCCGGKAYNISDEYKFPLPVNNYHADFSRIFNNSKNTLQANRFPENRFIYNSEDINPTVSAGTVRKDHSYISISGAGTGVLSGSGYPVFERELSYYGPFFQVDKCDFTVRRNEKQNTTKGNNQTCYSSKATIEVFPECFSQWYGEYNDCDGAPVFKSQQVPRLSFVYRGCDFEDPCNYNSSGHPYFAPTSVLDLTRGLAGQEIYMYLNLDNVWTTRHPQGACPCIDPLGLDPPTFVEVPSPVTFSSFPKFDLYPTGYGCKDPVWQIESIRKCNSAWSLGSCETLSSPYACKVRQPYTTYGFIRNLCGKKTDDKRKVITESFADLIQQGTFRNTNSSGTNLPMYWEFSNPYIHESGSSMSSGLKPSGLYGFWGLADTNGRLVAPHYKTTVATGITPCSSPATYYSYLNFNECATHQEGWPTDNTPFLIEIDHDDDCVSCASVFMENSGLHIDLSSLDVKFSHDRPSSEGDADSHMYGWNHCKYPGRIYDPTYTCASGFSTPCTGDFATLYAAEIAVASEPHTGSTCACLDTGTNSFSMIPVNISGSPIPVGWRTNSGRNSFVKLDGCSLDKPFLVPESISVLSLESSKYDVYGSFKLACSTNIFPYVQDPPSGLTSSYASNYWTNANAQSPLYTMYNGSTCAGNYPSADSDLKIQAKFVAVPTGYGYPEIFALLPDHAITASLENVYGALEALQVVVDTLDYVPIYKLEYGCLGYDATGVQTSGSFVGLCYQCTPSGIVDKTLTCDCPGIVCDSCDRVTTVDGESTTILPWRVRNRCGCDCNQQLMRRWLVDCSGNETLDWRLDSTGCAGLVVGIAYSGTKLQTSILPVGDFISSVQFAKYTEVYGESACRWHTGPNAISSGTFYEFEEPMRETDGVAKCSLTPSQCDGVCADDPQSNVGACKDPIPWSGTPPTNGVSIQKRACVPEIMIVNKIECVEDAFNLYVSREYHNHDRQWYYIQSIGSPPTPTCLAKQIGAYRYNPGTGLVCVQIPFATPTDSVTPAYYSVPVTGVAGTGSYRGVCIAHYSSGTFANQDFILSDTAIAAGEDRLWNYFNLFYESGMPSSKYFPAIYLGDQTDGNPPPDPCGTGVVYEDSAIFGTGLYFTPAGRLGVDWTNKFHSCLQDHEECGSEIYCNKMFFPRRSYLATTKISRFGPLQLCAASYERKVGDWYSGYQDFDANPSVITEMMDNKFVDVCNTQNIVNLQANVGIDDVILTVDDYLPLLSFGTGLFMYTISTKSCTIVGTGCHILPIHTDYSVNATYGGPRVYPHTSKKDTMGYYLDKVSWVDTDNCLFNPFKILVDVECCTSTIRTKYLPSGDPTNLEYVIDNVPSWGCHGVTKNIPCTCGNSTCVTADGTDNPVNSRHRCITVYVPGGPGCVKSTQIDGGTCAGTGCGTIVQGYPVVTCSGAHGPDFIYNPTIESTGGGYALLTSYCGSSPTCRRAVSLGPTVKVVTCNGISRTAIEETRMAYECDNGYLYIGKGAANHGCCDYPTICNLLADCHKVDPNACYAAANSGAANYINDFLHCGCQEIDQWDSCQDSVIRAIITEE